MRSIPKAKIFVWAICRKCGDLLPLGPFEDIPRDAACLAVWLSGCLAVGAWRYPTFMIPLEEGRQLGSTASTPLQWPLSGIHATAIELVDFYAKVIRVTSKDILIRDLYISMSKPRRRGPAPSSSSVQMRVCDAMRYSTACGYHALGSYLLVRQRRHCATARSKENEVAPVHGSTVMCVTVDEGEKGAGDVAK